LFGLRDESRSFSVLGGEAAGFNLRD